MGYDYIAFDDHHFRRTCSIPTRCPCSTAQALADREGLEWLSSQHLPCGREGRGTAQRGMYMAGSPLLTTTMAAMMAKSLAGSCASLMPAVPTPSTSTSCSPAVSGPSA
ncbi:MAG: hypothetical protein ACLTYN_10320 [Dysosmobacter welbionis]